MSDRAADLNWPKVLALSAHEVRSPLSVVLGYVRMLLSDRAGVLTAQQRKLLELSVASCGRLKGVADEMSELAHIEDGKTSFNRGPVELRAVLQRSIENLPDLPDREVHVHLSMDDGPARLNGDAERLRMALTWIVTAVRRELVASPELHVRERVRQENGRTVSWIAIGPPDRIDMLAATGVADLGPFAEYRGGCGLTLPVARRTIERHGGSVWSHPPHDPDVDETSDPNARLWKTSAVIVIPHG